MIEISNTLMNQIMSYLLQKADEGDTEAEALLDELNEVVNLQRNY
jgi:hypothetical protein